MDLFSCFQSSRGNDTIYVSMSWARAEGQGLIVLQREATSRAKWVAVSRFVTHSIVSRLRVNSETRICLED